MLGATLAVLLLLLAVSVPVAAALGVLGLVLSNFFSFMPLHLALGDTAWQTSVEYILIAIPLFVLLGEILLRSGIAAGVYAAIAEWVSWLPGGLMHANIGTCTLFAATSGSSVATAATIGTVAIPEIEKRRYDEALFLGSIAAGGTLGILIPPSVVFVIYGLMTETSISKLFAAGILPGMVGILFYLLAVQVVIRLRPELGPPAARTDWQGRWKALGGVSGVLTLFVVVIGGIYAGIFTPTEAAGIGAFGGFLFALGRRALTWRTAFDTFAETASTTTMLFMVLIGALLFANFVNAAGLPTAMIDTVKSMNLSPIAVILVILLIYIILGCVFESMSMIILTVPVFVPVVEALHFDLIWFGVVVVVVTEISLITPPVGMNVFVLRGLLPDVPTGRIFAGVMPFICADIVRLTVIVFVPWLSLIVPSFVGS